ncbi:TPA: hypothetical protein ACIBQR_002743 [Salmonella enterica subsp. enterica serovar Chester]
MALTTERQTPLSGQFKWSLIYSVVEAESRRQSEGLWSEPRQTEAWRWHSVHQDDAKND